MLFASWEVRITKNCYLGWLGCLCREPSGWLSTKVISFKILQSCLYKRFLLETGKETKRGLWQRSKKMYNIQIWLWPPYTERQYVKFSRTKDLNKWSIYTWEYCSFLRDLNTCKHLFTLTNFSLTCSLNLQLFWRVIRSKDRLLHCGIFQMSSYCMLLLIFLTTNSLHLLDQLKNSSTKRSTDQNCCLQELLLWSRLHI